jgi:hypothetical protein
MVRKQSKHSTNLLVKGFNAQGIEWFAEFAIFSLMEIALSSRVMLE